MMFQTEFEFSLPNGYVDGDGNLHKDGVMRLATAADEILPLKDPRVQSNPAYLSVILLSRVITKLGNLHSISPHNIENLFIADMAYLQDLYQRINENGSDMMKTVCPKCEHMFEIEVNEQGK
ncbi:MAG TPA: phage tail assembly protein [Methanosarcinaceae archaeon]|nr:phage tail assembly protein [Methanosarcinaceae archaeon]